MTNPTISQVITRDGNNLDLIRLVASLAVIFYHSFPLNPQWELADPVKALFPYVSTGALAVKIFFFISGLLVVNSILTRQCTLHFVVSRLLRVFPGLIFVVICSTFIIGPIFTKLPVADYLSSAQLYDYVLNNILLDTRYFLPGLFLESKYGVNGSLWTIRYEVIAYGVVLISYLLKLMSNRFISSLACLLVIVEPLTPFKGVLFANSDNGAIYMLAPCFALGALLAINKNSYRTNFIVPIVMFFLVFCFNNESVKLLLICSSVCLLSLHLSTLPIIKKITIKNDVSYGVYLWGFPIQQIISINFHFGIFMNVALSMLIAMVFAMLSWKLIEKPAIALSKKLVPSTPKITAGTGY